MGRQRNRTSWWAPWRLAKGGLGFVLMAGLLSPSYGRIWDIGLSPAVSLSQIYSDNLNLGGIGTGIGVGVPTLSGGQQGGFVTQLAPLINISRQGARSKFDLNYRLQALFYEGIDIDPRLYNQLQMNSKTEIYDDSLFLDSSSTISQANISSLGAFSPDNIFRSTAVNSTTYRTIRLSPYWRPHLGGYAEGEFRYSYYNFSNDVTNVGSTTAFPNLNLNSDTHQEFIHLVNGRRFDSIGLTWRLSAYNQEQNFEQATNTRSITFRSINGEVSYLLINDISAFVQSGYYNNQLPTNTVRANNGLYVTPGLSWAPSPKFSIAAGYGYNAYFTNLNWRPSQRTSLQFSYRDSQVGGSNYGQLGFGGGTALAGAGAIPGFDYNSFGGGTAPAAGANTPTGALGAANAGSVWNANLRHQTRSTAWQASYYTTTTTIQQTLANLATFTTPTDLNGNPTGAPFANDRAIFLPDLTNSVITVKRAQLSGTWFTPRTSLQLTAFQGDYSYSTTDRNQDTYGISASWNWRFTARTNATVFGSWQTSRFSGDTPNIGNRETEFMSASVRMNRQLSSFMTGYLEYQYFKNDTTGATAANNLLGYDANRVTASININF